MWDKRKRAGMLTLSCYEGLYNLLKLGLIHGDISSGNCFVIEEHSGAVIEK
jgi:RIO-like serine/threonine protein kinase